LKQLHEQVKEEDGRMEKEKKKLDKKLVGIVAGLGMVGVFAAAYILISLFSGAEETAKQPGKTFVATEEIKEFTTIGSFISYFHDFYNETACYGRMDSLNWEEQKAAAENILHSLGGLKTDNKDLSKDFKEMAKMASEIKNDEKNKSMIKKLHRYFHDLDIHYNGYQGSADVFRITQFK
jgi:cytoskeletal protein RodZ